MLAFSPGTTIYTASSLLVTPISYNIVLFSEDQGENPFMYIGNHNVRTYGGISQVRSSFFFSTTSYTYSYASAPVPPTKTSYPVRLLPKLLILRKDLLLGLARGQIRNVQPALSRFPMLPGGCKRTRGKSQPKDASTLRGVGWQLAIRQGGRRVLRER